MNLQEILANKELAIYKKKAEIQKTDYSNVLFEAVEKAYNNTITKLEVLVYEAVIDKRRNEEMFKNYINGWVLNHSVGMRYIKLLFCYDSDDPAFTQDKENFDKYSPMILNKDDVGDHFWAILEAKNIEASSVVKGSNFLTPVLDLQVIDENTIKVKLAISPSNIIDSHRDVHIPNIWKKSLNENKYDLLLQEHDMSFNKVITDSVTGDLKVYTEMIDVKLLMSKFNINKTVAVENTIEIKEEPSIEDTQMQRKKSLLI